MHKILYKYSTHVFLPESKPSLLFNNIIIMNMYKILHTTLELTRMWIRIQMQVIKHLEIGLYLENGVLSYLQFVDSFRASNYNLLHLITLKNWMLACSLVIFFKNNSQVLVWPCLAAQWSGVIFWLPVGFLSWTLSMINLQILMDPFVAALWSGVSPQSLFGFLSWMLLIMNSFIIISQMLK